MPVAPLIMIVKNGIEYSAACDNNDKTNPKIILVPDFLRKYLMHSVYSFRLPVSL